MFNWVVKVVPHPPDGAESLGEEPVTVDVKTSNRAKLKSSKSIREEDQTSQTSQGSVQSGVLNWLSNGFVSALPQPAGSPLLTRANSDAKALQEDGSADRAGVIGWISQGIGKVVPQPDEKYRQGENRDPEDVTEVYDVKDLPDAEPLPHIPVVEMLSEDEISEVEPPGQFPPKVMSWIRSGFQNALPQHVARPPNHSETCSTRSSQCSNKVYSPPPESVTSVTEIDTKSASMVGKIVQGLGLALPQPVLKTKETHMEDMEIVQNGNAKSVPADLILEEVDSEDEAQGKQTHSDQLSEQPADKTQLGNSLPSSQAQSHPQTPVSQEPPHPPSVTTPSQAHIQLEDAETQTARWTPMIESIKREAEDSALLIMEERLIQERLEMARMAEEVARQTAEMAVRELAQARLGIQTTIVEEAEDVDQELQVLQEEESEIGITRDQITECQEVPVVREFIPEGEEEVTEPAITAETPVEEFKPSSPQEEPEPEPETQPEPEIIPESEIEPEPEIEPDPTEEDPIAAEVPEKESQRDSESESESEPELGPITQQPQSIASGSVSQSDTPVESAATEEESGVPSRCDALKSCLMRLPYAPQSVDRFHQFLKDNEISLPRVPSMPSLPSSFSQITLLPSLPPRLSQLSQLPQQISQQISKIPQQFPSLSQPNFSVPQFPSLPQQLSNIPQRLSNLPQKLSNIPQSLTIIPQRLSNLPQQVSNIPHQLASIPQKISSIPQKISNIPQCAQQYYTNVQSRLNKLKPEHDAQAATAED